MVGNAHRNGCSRFALIELGSDGERRIERRQECASDRIVRGAIHAHASGDGRIAAARQRARDRSLGFEPDGDAPTAVNRAARARSQIAVQHRAAAERRTRIERHAAVELTQIAQRRTVELNGERLVENRQEIGIGIGTVFERTIRLQYLDEARVVFARSAGSLALVMNASFEPQALAFPLHR